MLDIPLGPMLSDITSIDFFPQFDAIPFSEYDILAQMNEFVTGGLHSPVRQSMIPTNVDNCRK